MYFYSVTIFPLVFIKLAITSRNHRFPNIVFNISPAK